MNVPVVQTSDSLAPIAEANEKREISKLKLALATDETSKRERQDCPRRGSFFECLRRALSTPHV